MRALLVITLRPVEQGQYGFSRRRVNLRPRFTITKADDPLIVYTPSGP